MRDLMKKLTVDDLRERLLDHNYTFTEEEITDFKDNDAVKFTVSLDELSFEITCNGTQIIVQTSTQRYLGFATVDTVMEYLTMMKRVDKVLTFGEKKDELKKD